MFFYAVTFGGFVGLASSLTIYFNDQYGLSPVTAGYFTAACVFAGSLVRPIGGALADRIGGIRALSIMYIVAAAALGGRVSFGLARGLDGARRLRRRHAGAGHGQRRGVPAGAAALPREIGVMTGLVGMTGGIGGFYLASSLGYSKQLTGNYQAGLPASSRACDGGADRPHQRQDALADDLGRRRRQRCEDLTGRPRVEMPARADADSLSLLRLAVRHDAGSRAAGADRRRARLPDQQGRPVPQGLDGGRACSPRRTG